MKTKTFFVCMVLCSIIITLVSCEPTNLDKNNVLINLAELGEELKGKSVEEFDQVITGKNFTKCHEKSFTKGNDFRGNYIYSNGVLVDSTWFEKDITSKISLLNDKASILIVDYFHIQGQTRIQLLSYYILPNDPAKDYKTLSNNLYHYYSTNYSYKVSTEDPEELEQGYWWLADIKMDSTQLNYSNDNEWFDTSLQAGWMTQEEYDKKMADCEGRFRKAFVKQLEKPYLEVIEDIYAENTTINIYSGLNISNELDGLWFKASGVMIASSYWWGIKLDSKGGFTKDPQLPIQKRSFPNSIKTFDKK